MKKFASLILACFAVIFSSNCAVFQKRGEDFQLAWRTTRIQNEMVDITGRLALRYRSLSALFARLECALLATRAKKNEDKARVMQQSSHEAMAKGNLCTIVCEDAMYGTAPLGRDANSVKKGVSRKLKRLYLLARTAMSDIAEIHGEMGVELPESQLFATKNAIFAIEEALDIFESVCTRAKDERRVFSDNLFILHTMNFDALFPSLNLLERCLYKFEQKIANDESNVALLHSKHELDLYAWCWNEPFSNLKQWIASNFILDAKNEKKRRRYVFELFEGLWKRLSDASRTKNLLIRLFDEAYDECFDDADPRSYESEIALNRLHKLARSHFDSLFKNYEKICDEMRKIEAQIHQKHRFSNPLNYFLILEHKKATEDVADFILTIKECEIRQEMHRDAFSRRPPLTLLQRFLICFYD